MAKSPNWTIIELALLKEKYPVLGRSKELLSLFSNRTIEGICLKANRLGLKTNINLRKRKTNEEYTDLLEKTNFIALEAYKGSTVPIMHMCGICDHEWLTRPQHVLKIGAKCPKCDENTRLATSAVRLIEVAGILEASGFIPLSEYTGALDSIRLKHIHCGYEWNTVYSYIQQGSGCPKCNVGFGYITKNNFPEIA